MAELNTSRILNSSKSKELRRSFDELKKDFTKINAIEYKRLYESETSSFLLDNSRYIFTEPYRGLEFYKEFVENNNTPLHRLIPELDKVTSYIESIENRVPETQMLLYSELREILEAKVSEKKRVIRLQEANEPDTDMIDIVYDVIYENREQIDEISSDIIALFNECAPNAIIDFMNICLENEELHRVIKTYIEAVYIATPKSYAEFVSNLQLSVIMESIFTDKRFDNIFTEMTNLGTKNSIVDVIDNINMDFLYEKHCMITNGDDIIGNSDIITKLFEYEDSSYKEELFADEKLHSLMCEKHVIDMISQTMNSVYMEDVSEDIPVSMKCVAEYVSKIDEVIEGDLFQQINILEDYSTKISDDIDILLERYFANGNPNPIVTSSLGYKNTHDVDAYKKAEDKPKDSEDEDETDDDDDEILRKKVDDKPMAITESTLQEIENMSLGTQIKFQSTYTESTGETPETIEVNMVTEAAKKPEAPNVFQKIQNKALDADVQYKKKVAKGKRTAVDAKNAVKAVTKIPANIVNAVKKQLNEWDEMDDNRRKKYMIEPGFRKKYFRAFRTAILHYGAFAINPVYNIILFMAQAMSKEKDVRIRNEFVRELNAEIKVISEKIDDAKANGDNKQKYKMMRYKEKLDAEVKRIAANSKYL